MHEGLKSIRGFINEKKYERMLGENQYDSFGCNMEDGPNCFGMEILGVENLQD